MSVCLDRRLERLLEVLDRVHDVVLLRGAAGARVLRVAGEAGEDLPEHAVRLLVVGVELQRLLGCGLRFGGAIFAGEELRELGGNRGRRRVERHRAAIGRDRLVDIAGIGQHVRAPGRCGA